MRGSGPAAATAGAFALVWVVWELWRLAWLGQVVAGMKGVYVLDWVGPGSHGHPDGGAGTLIVFPLLLGGGLVVGSLAISRWRTRTGAVWLGLGAGCLAGWALFAGVIAFSSVVDGWLQPPVFAVKTDFGFSWAPWSRWIFDGTALLCICGLLGMGPDTGPARRAVWTGLLILIADNGWRVAVLLFAGGVPVLSDGLGFGWGVSVVWALLGLLAVGFVGLFANLPDARGPNRLTVYIALGLAGLWQGLSASLLWIAPLLDRAGVNALVHAEMPEYDGMLAVLRLLLFGVGAASVGLGVWRVRWRGHTRLEGEAQ